MWKKRLIWRNELVVFNNSVSNDTDTMSDRDAFHSSSRDINTERVSVRNGGFIPDTEGSLVIRYHYVPLHNISLHDDQIQEYSQQVPEDLVEYVPDPEQEAPMDLSLVKVELKEEAISNRDHDSGYTPSPPLVVDLTVTPDEDYNCTQAMTPDIRPLPDHLVARYPYLRLTNTGALVLWNFLWALVQDSVVMKV